VWGGGGGGWGGGLERGIWELGGKLEFDGKGCTKYMLFLKELVEGSGILHYYWKFSCDHNYIAGLALY